MSVKVSYAELGELQTQLTSIIGEFENAGARRRDLEGAVGSPYGKNDLKDVAHDFEGRWDDRRKRLMESCKAVADQVKGLVEGFQEFDVEAGSRTEER
ncbi:hypothetical protein [Microbacterium sp. 179-I 1D1 NHS]|uniref:hypothetical protein n=1 Tax=unclassified Microbacterium TaxID=2609290 RepID=UPI003879E24D